MNYRHCIIVLLLMLVLPSMNAKRYDDIISKLDYALEHRNEYIDRKEETIQGLKNLLSRTTPQAHLTIYEELFKLYYSFNTDSARYYSELCLKEARNPKWGNAESEQRVIIYQVQCMAINGLYGTAHETIFPLEDKLFPSNKLIYYQTLNMLYAWESEFSTIPGAVEAAKEQIVSSRDSIIAYSDNQLTIAHEKSLLAKYESPQASNKITLSILDTMSIDNPMLRHIAYTTAINYDKLGDRNAAKYYFALSAYSDISQGILEHASLRRLAVMLFQDGDLARAYKYIKQCMYDAETCGARLRTIQMSEDLAVILDSYQDSILHHQRRLNQTIAIMALLLVIFIISTFYVLRSHRHLSNANIKIMEYQNVLRKSHEELQEALDNVMILNRKLKDSNNIKSTYVTQYMKQCSATIAKIEDYSRMLLKTAITSNYGKLVETIKDTKVIDKELDDFYRSFDDTFLNLFPTFITDFNSMLAPDKQISIPKGKQLSTELRIFALIRLGISDSEEIALFLRHSVKTIYNYRSKIRSRAIDNSGDFEERLMHIGSPT